MSQLTDLLHDCARAEVVLALAEDENQLVAHSPAPLPRALHEALTLRSTEIVALLIRHKWWSCGCDDCAAKATVH
jgi:hypothetical protein